MSEQFEESYNHLIEKLEGWMDVFVTNIPNLIVASLVFASAYYLSGFIRSQLEKRLRGHVSDPALRSLIATMSSGIVIAVGIFIALSVMKLDTVLQSMLAGAGVAGLAIGLALQSSLANTFSGIYLSVRNVLNIGDWVETNGYQGTVHDLNLRNTIIRENDNNLVIIPNKLILDKPFKNFGLTDRVRVILKCGVAYDSDLEQVESVAKSAIEDNFPRDPSEDIEFHYLEFGGSSIDFQLRFWVDAKAKLTMLEARSEGIKVLKKAFDQHGIEIPFPIRTLYHVNGHSHSHSDDAQAAE